MKKNACNSLKCILAVQCLLFSLFTNNASAQFLYWNNNGTSVPTNGTWDLTTPQWATDSTPTASPVVWDSTNAAVFSVTNAGVGYLGNLTINLDSAIAIGGLYNNGTNGSSPVTNLIFTGTGSLNLASATNVIAVGNGSIGAGGGNNNIFRVPITGSGAVEFLANVGSEYLTVSNSYSGGTKISTGNGINFSASGVFGTGTITINPTQAQIVWATPATEPASAGGAPFATNPITLANNVVASSAAVGRFILVGNTNAPVTFTGDWDMGTFAQTLDFRNGTVAAPTTISGDISGSGTLTKIGNGVLVLSGANTYSGKTLINVGSISVSSINKVSGGNATSSLGAPTTEADGTINLGATTTAGSLIYTGTGETTDRVLNLAGTTGGATIQNDGTGAIIFTSPLTATGAGAKTLTLTGVNTSSNEIAGVIVDNSVANPTSLTKALQGIWKVSGSNTFSGKTIISRGTLSVNSLNNVVGGAPSSSLGAPTTVANGTINLGGGTTASALIYTGAGETSDRVINLTSTTGGCTIQSDGTGPLVLTSDFTVTGQNNKTLTLSGTNTGDNRIAGKIVNFNATTNTAVTKSGAGTWILSASNTFAGNMSFNAGLLKIANPAALGFGTNVISGTASFDNVTGADLTITNALTLSGGSVTYVGSSNNVTYTGPVTISGAATRTITVSSNMMTLNSGINEDATGGRSFTKAGAGTLRLLGANTYTGNTTVNAGTLILGPSASFATISNFTIAASGTLDASAIAAFTVPGTNVFTASGSNTVEGVSAAIIKGGTTVDLGTRPISLTFRPTSFTGDTGHPSLIVSQGTLSLGGNAFTVNNASGTALDAGTYQLISQTTGSIGTSGNHSVTVTGSGLVAGGSAEIQVSGGNVNLVVTVAPTGATILTPTILGDGSVQLNFVGTPSVSYIIQAATNLNEPITWLPLSTNTADGGGLFNFTDTDATNFVERYYRTENE